MADPTLKTIRVLSVVMVAWEWLALGLGVLLLLQLLALQYAMRMSSDDGERNGPQPTPKPPVDPAGDTGGDAPEPDGDRIACPHCGAKNDPYYTYCRRCVSSMR